MHAQGNAQMFSLVDFVADHFLAKLHSTHCAKRTRTESEVFATELLMKYKIPFDLPPKKQKVFKGRGHHSWIVNDSNY